MGERSSPRRMREEYEHSPRFRSSPRWRLAATRTTYNYEDVEQHQYDRHMYNPMPRRRPSGGHDDEWRNSSAYNEEGLYRERLEPGHANFGYRDGRDGREHPHRSHSVEDHRPVHLKMEEDRLRNDKHVFRRSDSASSSLSEQPAKSSLAFILDGQDGQGEAQDKDEQNHYREEQKYSDCSNGASAHSRKLSSDNKKPDRAHIKKSRICKFENCTRYVVNRGLCIGHGGGKRCSVSGCTSSAKNMGLCWKHGGSTKCTIDGCTNRAKSRGVCWSHGGGKQCKEDDCSKTAVSNGLCWAHGGGKRCMIEGCKKPAYERNGNLCNMHQGHS